MTSFFFSNALNKTLYQDYAFYISNEIQLNRNRGKKP